MTDPWIKLGALYCNSSNLKQARWWQWGGGETEPEAMSQVDNEG